eukprot:scaffold3043_cov180-Amphora_coffeaeformis.AAC.28
MSGVDKSKETAKPPPGGGIDGNEFLQSLRGSVPAGHYNGTLPQTAGEHLAATVSSTPQSFPVPPPPRPSLGKNQKKVSLQDVLQSEPVENEVDTALVQSLDERSSQSNSSRPNHRAVATGTSTILSNIPLDEMAVHEFEIEHEPPDMSPFDDDDEAALDGGLEGSGRPTSQRSSQSRPLLQRNATMTKSTRSSVHKHQRGKSVEQSLVDLTMALSEMHGSSPKIKRHQHRDTSGADEFASNALRLHSQQAQEESTVEAAPHSMTGTVNGRRLWDTLLDSLPTLQERANREAAAGSATSSGTSSGDEAQGVPPEVLPGIADTTADVEQGSPTKDSDEKHSPPRRNDSLSSEANTNAGRQQGRKNKTKRRKQNGMRTSMVGKDGMESEGRRGHRTMDKFKEDWQVWTEFFRPRQEHMVTYLKTVILYLIIPLVGISAILYYFADNPPTGRVDEETRATETDRPSASYILLFCCRQLVTFSMAFASQIFVVDFIALNTRIMLNLVGPVLTLLVVQSKGWPFILLWWSIFDFALLAGDYPFAHHWLRFQSFIGFLSENNPSGQLVDNEWYWRALSIAISVSLAVSVKRFIVGLYLGRATFTHYGKPLAKVMSKVLLVGEVASFAKDVEQFADERGEGTAEKLIKENAAMHGLVFNDSNEDDEATNMSGSRYFDTSTRSMDPAKRDPLTGTLQMSEKMQIMQLLEQWEEPVQHDNRSGNEIASISAVLRFRKALTFIHKRFPFGKEFGPADTRAACIESAQEIYHRLMLATPGEEFLSFETMAFLALEDDGTINQDKVKAMIKLFRPDRQGNLTLLDFCKSVDAVYKEFRFLGATIENSSRIDRAFENIFNAVFYVILGSIILSQLGFDPLSLFLSLSSVILAFAFMIGSASAKYFEGILFILVRRPYGIGDRVQVGNIESNASLHGALPWCVDNVTLFETTLVYLPTNERASLSNGSLANSRIINWARRCVVVAVNTLAVRLFPLNTPYQKLVLFKRAVEEYMRARPREWRALNGFRCNMVYAKENYMEYIIVIQHREAWQEVGQVLDSKANLTSYCQEVARQLDMEYQAPQVPIHLTQGASAGLTQDRSQEQPLRRSATAADDEQFDENELAHKFADIAHKKHGIRVC